MNETEKPTIPLFGKILWVWIFLLVFTNCFRAIRSAFMLGLVVLADRFSSQELSNLVNLVFGIETVRSYEIYLLVYKFILAVSLTTIIVFFSRQKDWSRFYLRMGLILDVVVLVGSIFAFLQWGHTRRDIATVQLQAVYAILIEIPAIILLGHPILKDYWDTLKKPDGKVERKDNK